MIISVVTINFNNSEGLIKTIQSVKSQLISYDAIEYIVIDGGSDDGSADVILNNSNVINKYVIEKDDGIFDAMNKGVKLASGNYIYFLNSGDVFSSENVVDEILNELNYHKPNILVGRVNTTYNHIFLREADLTPWICHQAAFVLTSLMNKYMFDPSFKVFGDLDLWFRLKRNAEYNLMFSSVLIADMEMDGVGNDPKYYKIRAADKLAFNKKHNLTSRTIIDSVTTRMHYLVARIFGYKFYHGVFLGYYAKIRRLLS